MDVLHLPLDWAFRYRVGRSVFILIPLILMFYNSEEYPIAANPVNQGYPIQNQPQGYLIQTQAQGYAVQNQAQGPPSYQPSAKA